MVTKERINKEITEKVTMNLNELRDQIHANSVEKGFWDKPLSDSHFLMLVITELSEAVEADRKDIWINGDAFDQLTIIEYSVTYKHSSFTESIFHITRFICANSGSIETSSVTPEMMLLEILGFAEHLDIDLFWHIEQKMKYNQSRERMHGKKY